MNLKLKSSARAKKNYILLETSGRTDVERAVLDYLGVLGWAKASPIFVEGGKKEGRLILAVNREEIEKIRAAFELSPKKIKIIKVSGTIKGLDG
jgi:RNase P/RNase MRP subunit POP5